jgi:hypothetical protein
MKPTARRKRLVEKGGVEIFEVRVVQWFDTEGRVWSSVETSTPDGPGPVPLHEAVGALEVAKAILIGQREEA